MSNFVFVRTPAWFSWVVTVIAVIVLPLNVGAAAQPEALADAVKLYAEALQSHAGIEVVATRSSQGEGTPGHHRLPPPDGARLFVRPPSGYKLEVLRAGKVIETVVSEGKHQWLWNSKFYTQGKAPRRLRFMSPDIEWAEKAYWPLMLFTSPALIEHLSRAELGSDKLDGRAMQVIKGQTHPGSTAVRLQLWLDSQTHLPRRLDADDGQVKVRMDFVVSLRAPDLETFAARPPKGLPRRTQEPEYPRVATGRPAPAFSLKSMEGKAVSPTQHRGKCVLLDFWAPWCPTCMLISPFINHVQTRLGARGLQVLAVSTMASAQELEGYVKANPQSVQVLFDPADEEQTVGYARYKISGLPSYVLVDRKSKVMRTWKYYFPGASEARLLAYVEEALDAG